jgi:stage V sporulation protein B
MADDDTARNAGRGGLAVATAKIYFILLGLVQQVTLPLVLGLDGYGALSRVLSIASVTYNPITTMSIQGVSRTLVQSPSEQAPATIRKLLRIHGLFGVLLGALFFLLSPQIARLAGAEHVELPLRILSGVLVLYGLYTPLIGVVNGQRRFLWQAGFDMASATLRTVGLLGGAWLALRAHASGPAGSAAGFVASTSLVLLLALLVVGVGKAGPASISLGRYFAFVLPLLVGQVLLNLLFQADLTLLGRFASEAARAEGLPASRADVLVGAYRATQLFSFLPYQVLTAVTFILFPMLASAAQLNDAAAIKRYVRTGVRLSLIIAGAMISVTIGLAPRLLALLFGEEAAALGGNALSLLALGCGSFAIFGILTTVLNSLGRTRQSALVTGFAVVIVAGLVFGRVRGAPLREELLWLTAQATTIGFFAATLTAALLVYRAAGGVTPTLTLLRTLLALAVAAAFARFVFPPGKLLTLVASALTPCVFLGMLVLTRELTRADLQLIHSVVRRRQAN